MATDPNSLARRLLQRAWNRDGLPEMAVGLTFLLISALLYAVSTLPDHSIGRNVAILVLAFGVPALMFATAPIIRRIKNTWLVERSGYVQPLPVPRKRYLLPIGIALFAMPLVWYLGQTMEHFLIAVTGLFGGAILMSIAWSGRMLRLGILGCLMVGLGVGIGLTTTTLDRGFFVLFGAMGIVCMMSGTFTLFHLLAQKRKEAGER